VLSVSEDGLSWEGVSNPASSGASPSLGEDGTNRLVAGGPGYVIVGSICDNRQPSCNDNVDGVFTDAAVWVSEDGRQWREIQSDSFTGPGIQQMNSVAVGSHKPVAVGSEGTQAAADLDAAVWVSTDGEVWDRVVDDDLVAAGIQEMWGVAAYGEGFVAVGIYEQPSGGGAPGVWISLDGMDWERVDDPAFDLSNEQISPWLYTVTPRGPGVVITGLGPATWFARPEPNN
jgi:hypothetical protein